MAKLARLLIRVFFRQVELQHPENLPKTGPIVLVANHTNGLVDGLLLMATLGRYPRFLGKSTLFKITPLWPFLKFAGVIPVNRVMDGVAPAHNASAFATCHDLLAQGGLVALFPEGISHDELNVQPLKTGAARIAFEAGVNAAVEGVTMVAVGLIYDAKARFRSRALVRIGAPLEVSTWAASYRSDGHAAVRQLTDDLADQLATVSPSYSSWSQHEGLSRLSEVVVRRAEGPPSADVGMAGQVQVADRLARAERKHPTSSSFQALLSAFASYERDLNLLGISDAQVAAEYSRSRLRRSLALSALKVIVSLPMAAIGVVVHVIPFQIMKQLSKRPTNEGIKATVKLLGCTALFAAVYTALELFAGRSFGVWVGMLAAVVAPLCGYTAVRLSERVKRIGGLVEGYRAVKGRGSVLNSVFARRQSVVDAAQSVLNMK